MKTIEQAPNDAGTIRRGITYVNRLSDHVDASKLEIKVIAFFEFEKDDRGWDDVVSAMPQYLGHYQPRIPDDFVFEDRRFSGKLHRQINLARQYGLHGFCFKKKWPLEQGTLERPVRQFLEDPTLNLNFCLCWTSEDSVWTFQKPDEPARKVLSEDSSGLLGVPAEVFLDHRYIKIGGKLLLIFCGTDALVNQGAIDSLRSQARNLGLPELFLVTARTDAGIDPEYSICDAAVDLPPYFHRLSESTKESANADPGFKGRIYDYSDLVDRHARAIEPNFVCFNTILPGWDDEACKPASGNSLNGVTPALYAKWLRECCIRAMKRPSEERLIFIRSWNDWRHGSYLEPDRKFGYAFLHATANVLRSYHTDPEKRKLVESINAAFVASSKVAVIFHCHYEDLIPTVFDRDISQAKGADLFVTVRNDISIAALQEIRKRSPNVYFLCNENRGRDIRPFLLAMRHIGSLGYTIACKVHTKKTPQSVYGFGDSWRQGMMQALLGSPESVAKASNIFSSEPEVGLLVPQGSVLDLNPRHVHARNSFWLDYFFERIGRSDLVGNYAIKFPAGSMFWFRVSALSGLDHLALEGDEFEEELGQVDGTLAHAVERLVALYAQERGYSMKEIT